MAPRNGAVLTHTLTAFLPAPALGFSWLTYLYSLLGEKDAMLSKRPETNVD